jgi:hypothetical protein
MIHEITRTNSKRAVRLARALVVIKAFDTDSTGAECDRISMDALVAELATFLPVAIFTKQALVRGSV